MSVLINDDGYLIFRTVNGWVVADPDTFLAVFTKTESLAALKELYPVKRPQLATALAIMGVDFRAVVARQLREGSTDKELMVRHAVGAGWIAGIRKELGLRRAMGRPSAETDILRLRNLWDEHDMNCSAAAKAAGVDRRTFASRYRGAREKPAG